MIARALILLVRGWQLSFSAVLPPSCRFAPSCSAYAIDALRQHGAVKGSALAVRRIMRCHPWGGSGFDPVPGTAATISKPDACGDGHRGSSR